MLQKGFMNGETWMDELKYHKVVGKASGKGVEIHAHTPQEAPDWMKLSWDSSSGCVDYGTGRLGVFVDGRREYYLPTLDLSVVPECARLAIKRLAWGETFSPANENVMKPVPWLRIELDPRYNKQLKLTLHTERYVRVLRSGKTTAATKDSEDKTGKTTTPTTSESVPH